MALWKLGFIVDKCGFKVEFVLREDRFKIQEYASAEQTQLKYVRYARVFKSRTND
jgi:hypothetical protein